MESRRGSTWQWREPEIFRLVHSYCKEKRISSLFAVDRKKTSVYRRKETRKVVPSELEETKPNFSSRSKLFRCIQESVWCCFVAIDDVVEVREMLKCDLEKRGVEVSIRKDAEKCVSSQLFDWKEINRVYRNYQRIKKQRLKWRKKKYPMPTISDFYEYHRIDPSPFITQILLLPKSQALEAAKDPNDEELSFVEYTVAIWFLTSFELSALAFCIIDTEGWGSVTRTQIRELVAHVYANPTKKVKQRIDTSKTHKIPPGVDDKLARILDGLGETVTRDEFTHITTKYHHLLLPAFCTRRLLRENIFGASVQWNSIEARRRQKVQHRTVQQVIAQLAENHFPDLAKCVPPQADSYKYQVDSSKVLDHAAQAYKTGDYARAKEVYAHLNDFDTLNPRAIQNAKLKDAQAAKTAVEAALAAEAARKTKKIFGFVIYRPKPRRVQDQHCVYRNPALGLMDLS